MQSLRRLYSSRGSAFLSKENLLQHEHVAFHTPITQHCDTMQKINFDSSKSQKNTAHTQNL